MSGEVKEECALAAVSLSKKLDSYPKGAAAFYLYKMLLQQQHRGQLSAGITTYKKDRKQVIDTYKKLGKVDNAFKTFRKEKFYGILNKYAGSIGIGHLRYSTCGADDVGFAQPFERHHGRRWKWFSFAFNGNIANYASLKKELADSDYHLIRDVDTEALMHHMSKQMIGSEKKGIEDVFANLAQIIDGAYSLVYMNADGELAVIRDPVGFKPLCYAEKDGDFFAASESVAFNGDGSMKVHDVQPGEVVLVSDGNVEKKRFAKCEKKAHCIFEWVYFANPRSIIDGQGVYEARQNLGIALAKHESQKMDKDFIVVPVPDTAKPSGDALAFELGVPSKEGIMRNRYIGRTFIESDSRAEKVKEKYSIIKSIVEGKKILLVEDTIVRGTTTKNLIERLKKYGKAKEIHLRVACPPILAPCFYGIDMSTINELIAPGYVKDIAEGITEEESAKFAKDYGVESLIYLPKDELAKAIGLPKNELCMGCLNANYPTPEGKRLYGSALENSKSGSKKRTYE